MNIHLSYWSKLCLNSLVDWFFLFLIYLQKIHIETKWYRILYYLSVMYQLYMKMIVIMTWLCLMDWPRVEANQAFSLVSIMHSYRTRIIKYLAGIEKRWLFCIMLWTDRTEQRMRNTAFLRGHLTASISSSISESLSNNICRLPSQECTAAKGHDFFFKPSIDWPTAATIEKNRFYEIKCQWKQQRPFIRNRPALFVGKILLAMNQWLFFEECGISANKSWSLS